MINIVLGMYTLSDYSFLIPFLISSVLAFNPILDLIKGPKTVEGTLTQAEVTRGRMKVRRRASNRTIRGDYTIKTEKGEYSFRLKGFRQNQFSKQMLQHIRQEKTKQVKVSILEHTKIAWVH